MRPRSLDRVVGQEETIADLLRDKGSGILWGPPGSGKTTIALLLAQESGLQFRQLSATSHGVKDLRAVLEESAEEDVLLFIDEIHRWSRSQQDALLPFVEKGDIRLVGATTEHPGHSINPALLSRLRVYKLQPLGEEDIRELLDRAAKEELEGVGVEEEAIEEIVLASEGDARRALLLLGRAAEEGKVTAETVQRSKGERIGGGGKSAHYEIASAFIKSMRGSDPAAALYWLARAESIGEDPRFLARRMLILASEDIGLARPGAISVATSVAEAVERLGEPECWISLAHGATYLALCPKSWDSYKGLRAAQDIVRRSPEYPVPDPLRPGSKLDPAAAKGYKHASEKGSEEMVFLPPEIERRKNEIFRKPAGDKDGE